MRSEEQVRERFNQLYERELDKKKKKFLSCNFRNCVYNDIHRVKGNGSFGFCHNPIVVSRTKQFLFVCNDEQTAKKCRYYKCKNNEQAVVESFHSELKSPAICGQKYPKLAVLLWFLQRMPDAEEATRFKRLCGCAKDLFRSLRCLLTFRWF